MERKNTPNKNRSPKKKRKIRPYFRMSWRNSHGRLIWKRRTPLFDILHEEHEANKSKGVKRSRTKVDGSNEAGSSKGKITMKVSDNKLMQGRSSGNPSGTQLPDKAKIIQILNELMLIDTHAELSQPVNLDLEPNYYRVIRKPMNFGMIMMKLERGVYKNVEQIEADVYLTCSNVIKYRKTGTFCVQARKIGKKAHKDFATLKGTLPINNDQSPPVARLPPPPPAAATSAGNKRKRTETTADSSAAAAAAAINLDDEFPEHILKADRKAGNNKQFVVDMNRRHTFKKSCPDVTPPLIKEMQQLVPVGLDDPLSYASSLARFAADLGPIAWKIASKKIEAALPPGAQYGPGWVSEPVTTHDQSVTVAPPQPSLKQQAAAAASSDSNFEFPAGYFTDLLKIPLSDLESDDGDKFAKTMGLNNPPATVTETKKKIIPTDRNAKKPVKKTPSNFEIGSSSKHVPSSNPGYYNNAGKPKTTMPLNVGAGCYYTAATPSNAKPAESHGLSPEIIEAVRKLNSQNAAAAAVASAWKMPLPPNKQQQNPTMQGNSLLFQGQNPTMQGNSLLFQWQNQGSNRVTDMGGFNANFNHSSPAMMKQNWASKEPADFSFAGNNNMWGNGTGSSSTGAGVNVTNPNYVSVHNQQPVNLQTWEKNNNAWGFSAGSSTGGINLHNPNNIPILNQQPAVPQNWANNAWGFAAGSSSAGQAMPNLPMRMAPVNNVPTGSGMHPLVDLTGEEEEANLWLQL